MLFETPALESIDIDTPDDWFLAEAVASHLQASANQ
jgi:CMP-N-acetylneuraminic acid synthetase